MKTKERVNYCQSEGYFIATMANFPQIIVQMKTYEEMVRGVRQLFQTVVSEAQNVLWNEDFDFVEQPPESYARPTIEGKEDIQCKCSDEDKHGETSIMCCNHCGLPTEEFWQRGPSKQQPAEKDLMQDPFIKKHLNRINLIMGSVKAKRLFVECYPTDIGATHFPNSNFAVKEIFLPDIPPSKEQPAGVEKLNTKDLKIVFEHFDLPEEGQDQEWVAIIDKLCIVEAGKSKEDCWKQVLISFACLLSYNSNEKLPNEIIIRGKSSPPLPQPSGTGKEETLRGLIEKAFKDPYNNGRVHPGNNKNKDWEKFKKENNL